VEVLIASFALALGLSAMLVVFSSLMRMARLTDVERKGMHQARQIVEQLRTLPYTAPEFSVGTHTAWGGRYVVTSLGGYPSTVQIQFLYDVVTPNGSTSLVALTTVMTSGFHP
jgi:hypothetical protein